MLGCALEVVGGGLDGVEGGEAGAGFFDVVLHVGEAGCGAIDSARACPPNAPSIANTLSASAPGPEPPSSTAPTGAPTRAASFSTCAVICA